LLSVLQVAQVITSKVSPSAVANASSAGYCWHIRIAASTSSAAKTAAHATGTGHDYKQKCLVMRQLLLGYHSDWRQ
jgi:hypothetical protein